VLRTDRYRTLRPFVIALVGVAAAAFVRWLFNPLIPGPRLPFLFFFPAVALVGLTGNLAAALFATVLSAFVASELFISPFETGAPETTALITFVVTGGAIAAITARLDAARTSSAERARVATERSEELERERAKLEREGRRLTLLADVSHVSPPSPTFEEVASHAARRIAETIGEGCIIRIHEGDRLVPVAWHHSSVEAMPFLAATLRESDEVSQNEYYARLREERHTLILNNLDRSDLGGLAPELQRLHEKYKSQHAFITPVLIGDTLLGTLSVFRTEDVPYPDGDVRAAEAIAARIALALENARLFETAQRDAEDARKARTIAEDASRVKDEFLATLSHELRTPLNAIVGWAHMLRDPALSEDRRRAAVETIVRNAQSQEQLIADILDVQRIMAGKLRLDLRSADLSDIVRAAAETVQPSADAKDIKLQLLLDLNVTPIWGDADRLQQVTWNLLSNAIKFTPPRGRVQVRLQQTDTECEMVVQDDGPGISSEFLPYVFERFRQADSSSTRIHKGLGLGLAIVRNLVELHGGSITASNASEAGGTGAVFTIKLPRRPVGRVPVAAGFNLAATTSDETATWFGEGPSLDGIGVLVVDDDPDARELVSTILQRYGASVTLAASVAEGIAALAKELPDVVVTDIEMPHEDGYTFIRRIRALPREAGGKLPAAALTAYAGAADRMKVLGAGFNMHIAKPVQPAELALIVASLAGKSVAEQQTAQK